MKTNSKLHLYLLTALLAFLAATQGCGGKGLERRVVTGNVTIDGRPVEMGEIRFIPIKGTETPMWSATITNGQYSAHGKGGVPVGTHRVEFHAYVSANIGAANSIAATSLRQILPPKFNKQSTYELKVEPGSGKIVKDFNLSTSS